jgi:hypothetical protein
MEKFKNNNHPFILNKMEKEAFYYFNNILIKPECPKCHSNKKVVKLIHTNTSKSLEKIYKTSGAIQIAGKHSKLNRWICRKCEGDF